MIKSGDINNLIVENLNDLVAVINKNYAFEYINEKVHKELTGYSNEDLIGREVLSFIHFEDHKKLMYEFDNSLQTGIDFAELRFKHKEGHYIWLESNGNLFLGKDGKEKFLVISRDITKRKIAEEKLKDSEEKYRFISETANDLIGILNKKFKYEYLNKQAFRQYLGYKEEDLLGKSALKFIHPEDLSMIAKKLFEGFKHGKGSGEFRFRHKNGHWLWLEGSGQRFSDSRGNMKAIIISRDITERKISEEKLKESEEKYRKFVEQSQDGVVLVDEKGTIIEWNKAQEDIFGLKREEVIGKYIWDVQYQTLPDNLRNSKTHETLKFSMKQTFKTGKTPWLNNIKEIEIQDIEDNHLIVQQSRFAIKTNKGFMLGSITRDVTKIKEVEQRIKESETKYRKAYNRARFYKDLFTHDMNNILSIITSSSELIPFYLTESKKSNDIKNLTTIVQNQVERGAKLIRNVNILSELEEEEIHTEPTEVCELMRSSLDLIKKTYSSGTVNLNVNYPEDHVIVNANELLQDVFDNILINAIKYNENDKVEISINVSKINLNGMEYSKFEFIDNAIGVSDDRKEIIFKRGNRELKGTKGMGIGLSLVKKIIKSYKGKIWVEDKVKGDYSKGSNFILLIPETTT